jgi:hypothetical protein
VAWANAESLGLVTERGLCSGAILSSSRTIAPAGDLPQGAALTRDEEGGSSKTHGRRRTDRRSRTCRRWGRRWRSTRRCLRASYGSFGLGTGEGPCCGAIPNSSSPTVPAGDVPRRRGAAPPPGDGAVGGGPSPGPRTSNSRATRRYKRKPSRDRVRPAETGRGRHPSKPTEVMSAVGSEAQRGRRPGSRARAPGRRS